MRKNDFLESFENLVFEVRELKKLSNKTLGILQNQSLMKEDASISEEWISVKDTCKILGCSEVTLWKLRKESIIPFSRLNRTIRFKKSDILNYLNQIQ